MSEEHPLKLSFLVHDVARLRQTEYDKLMKPLGITRSQYWVLSNLTRPDGNGMVQTELAKLMSVGKVTLGGLLDRLEDRGLVERRGSPSDRRAKSVFLTKDGKKMVGKMKVIAEEFNAGLQDGLSSKDIETTEKVLSHVKKRLLSLT